MLYLIKLFKYEMCIVCFLGANLKHINTHFSGFECEKILKMLCFCNV